MDTDTHLLVALTIVCYASLVIAILAILTPVVRATDRGQLLMVAGAWLVVAALYVLIRAVAGA